LPVAVRDSDVCAPALKRNPISAKGRQVFVAVILDAFSDCEPGRQTVEVLAR
jgi:hypothetical protein